MIKVVSKNFCASDAVGSPEDPMPGMRWKKNAGTLGWAVRPIPRGPGVHGQLAERLHGKSIRRYESAKSCGPTNYLDYPHPTLRPRARAAQPL